MFTQINHRSVLSSKKNCDKLTIQMGLLLFSIFTLPALALEITQRNVTWTIVGDPVNGTYANGDPWVVGPVTITSISPFASA